MKQELINIYTTLNQIETKGYENMCMLIGCMNKIKELIEESGDE